MASASSRPRAVSITPVPIQADMRALKIAYSLERLGFDSWVMAGGGAPLPLAQLDLSAPQPPSPPGWSRFSPIAAMRRGAAGFAGEALLFAGYIADHFLRYQWLPRLRIPRADLYYLHSFEYHAALSRHPCLKIYDAHDFYQGVDPDAAIPHFDRHWVKPFARQREQQCVEAAHAVVTVSDGVAELIAQTFGCPAYIVRNAHDARLENAAAGDIRQRLGLDPGVKLMTMVGNDKPNIDLDLALAVMRHLPGHIHLAMIGRGYESSLAAIDPALRHRLHCPGAVGAAQIVPLIRSADLGWLLYRAHSANSRNGLPNGFFQMLAAGLPLLYPDFPEIIKILDGQEIGGCVTGLAPKTIAEKILRLLDNGRQYRRRALVLAEAVSWEQEENKLRIILRDLYLQHGRIWPEAMNKTALRILDAAAVVMPVKHGGRFLPPIGADNNDTIAALRRPV